MSSVWRLLDPILRDQGVVAAGTCMCNAIVIVWQIIFSGLSASLSWFFFLVSSIANMRTGRSKSIRINNFEVNVS